MIVEDIMKVDVAALSPDHSIAEALRLMNDRKIRHLPIIDSERRLVGIISDRDIRDAAPSIFQLDADRSELGKPLKTIMKTDIITGHPLDFAEEIAAVLYEHNIGCVPIVKEGTLVGIVTETDLLYTLVELTGANQPGSQIEVRVPNRAGVLSDLTEVFKDRKVNIQSVLVYPDKQDEQYKIIVLRVGTMNPQTLISDLKKAGYHVLWPNVQGMLP
jgi:acetoin utilization protein AcuB